LASPGMEIDLSAIAAGYAVDRAMQVLKDDGIRNALVNGGGEIYAIGFPSGRNAWRIGIRHPRKATELLGVIELNDETIATSGDYESFFESGGRRYSHIINPKTGWPVEGIMSVTILAKTTTEADALATALFPLGAEKGMKLIESLDDVECVMVTGKNEDDMKILMSSGIKDKVKLR
jgi:thiamine biosynthesis lipoprotein